MFVAKQRRRDVPAARASITRSLESGNRELDAVGPWLAAQIGAALYGDGDGGAGARDGEESVADDESPQGAVAYFDPSYMVRSLAATPADQE